MHLRILRISEVLHLILLNERGNGTLEREMIVPKNLVRVSIPDTKRL